MRVNSINSNQNFTGSKSKNVLNSVGIICSIGLVFALPSYILRKETDKRMAENIEYVKQHTPQKYELVKGEYGLDNSIIKGKHGTASAWNRAARETKDSLKIADEAAKLDSIAHTNYAKGMQAVRDSLAKVDSIKVAKKLVHK